MYTCIHCTFPGTFPVGTLPVVPFLVGAFPMGTFVYLQGISMSKCTVYIYIYIYIYIYMYTYGVQTRTKLLYCTSKLRIRYTIIMYPLVRSTHIRTVYDVQCMTSCNVRTCMECIYTVGTLPVVIFLIVTRINITVYSNYHINIIY